MTLDFDERDRESVRRDLHAADEEVRRLAVERIDLLPPAEAVELAVACLGDASWRVRKAAVERLVACPDRARATDALVEALGDGENSGRRNAAVEALIEGGARSLPRLIAATRSGDEDVRKLVVDALAGIGDARATDCLIDLLADPDPNVRAAAADALGAIGGERVLPVLLGAAAREDEDPLVRFSALHALGVLDAPVRASEIASVIDDPLLRPAGLALLVHGDDPGAAAVLLKGLTDASRSSREAAMRSLLQRLAGVDGREHDRLVGEIREAAATCEDLVPSAIGHLDDSDLSARLVLVQFLGLLGVERAVLPILREARDEALAQVALATLSALGETAERALDEAWGELDAASRRDACQLFGMTRGALGAARLLAALGDPDWEQRAIAARSIGERGLVEAIAPLVRRLEAAAADDEIENEEEIAAITDALITLAKPSSEGPDDAVTDRAIGLLSARLEGAPESVRLAIARVLGCIGRPRDTQLVALLLKDPGARVRRAAVDALARLEPGTAAEPLRLALADESPAVRMAAARALGASESDAVVADLRSLTADDDFRVRAAAVHATGTRFLGSGDPELRASAVAVIEAALRDEPPVALAAVEALREVGGPEAARAAVLLDRPEPELLLEAIRCLGAHADADPILPLVSHRDWSVRAEAIGALAERSVERAIPAILRRLETEQDEFVRGAILRALKRLED